MREVGVALRPDGVVELVQVDAVEADPGGETDLAFVAVGGAQRDAVGGGVHGDHLALVEHDVGARRGPPVEGLVSEHRRAAAPHRGGHGSHQLPVVEHADLLGDVIGDGDVGVADVQGGLRVGLAVEALAEFEAVHVDVHVDPGARRVVVLRPPVRDGIADPEPRALHRRLGPHDHVLLCQGLVGDRLVEVRDDDGPDAVADVLVRGEAALDLDVGVHVVVGHQGLEVGGARQRHPGAALAVHGQGVVPGEVQASGGLPGGAVLGQPALHRVAPVVVQGNVGDGAVDHVDDGFGHRVDVLGAVERRHPQQRRLWLGRGRDRGRRGGGGGLAAVRAAREPGDITDQHAGQQRHYHGTR